jgi:hypothetical protein
MIGLAVSGRRQGPSDDLKGTSKACGAAATNFCHSRPTPTPPAKTHRSQRARGQVARRASNGRSPESVFGRVTAGGRTLPSILHETLQRRTGDRRRRPGRAPLRLPPTPRSHSFVAPSRRCLCGPCTRCSDRAPRGPGIQEIHPPPALAAQPCARPRPLADSDSLFLARLPLLFVPPPILPACLPRRPSLPSPSSPAGLGSLAQCWFCPRHHQHPANRRQPLNLRRARLNPKVWPLPNTKSPCLHRLL